MFEERHHSNDLTRGANRDTKPPGGAYTVPNHLINPFLLMQRESDAMPGGTSITSEKMRVGKNVSLRELSSSRPRSMPRTFHYQFGWRPQVNMHVEFSNQQIRMERHLTMLSPEARSRDRECMMVLLENRSFGYPGTDGSFWSNYKVRAERCRCRCCLSAPLFATHMHWDQCRTYLSFFPTALTLDPRPFSPPG